MSASLECRNLSVRVGEAVLLSDVDAVVPAGTATAVIGPNGAGKSTLLRALAGSAHGRSGEVLLDGRDIARWPRPEVACRVAWLPQFRPVSVPLPVRDLVAMGRFPHLGAWRPPGKADREAVEAAMERLEIVHLADRDATTLSGGELQRAFLARCLAQGSPVLLLDEPLTGLDIGHQLSLLSLLDELAAEGRTILWSVHDLRLAAEHAREAWLLHGGRLVRRGGLDEVLGSPEAGAAFGIRCERGAEGWRFRAAGT